MNHIYQPQQAMNIYRESDAAEHHQREEGLFEVHYSNRLVKTFSTFMSAFLFYIRLEEPAALWDVTANASFIERKIFLGSAHSAGSYYRNAFLYRQYSTAMQLS